MAQEVDVDLIVEAISKGFDKVSDDLEEASRAQKELNKVQKEQPGILKRIGSAMTPINQGFELAKKGIDAVKKVWDFAAEGAQIAKVRDTFDSLTASIGETSAVVLGDLRAATAGMVADTDLIAAANSNISMGLANTSAEASKLAEIAVTLGSAMGKDATGAMEEFSLMLSNMSIPRLDTFGISASKVREKIKELQSANKDMSRETAFMTAVMDEAAISMEKLGDSVPVDQFTKASTSWNNMIDDLKVGVASGLEPAMSALDKRSEKDKLARPILAALNDDTEAFYKLQDEVRRATEGVNEEHLLYIEVLKLLEKGVTGTAEELVELSEAEVHNTKRAEAMELVYARLGREIASADAATEDLTDTQGRASDATDELNDKLQQHANDLSAVEMGLIKSQKAADQRTAWQENITAVENYKRALRGLPPVLTEAEDAVRDQAIVEMWKDAQREAEEATADAEDFNEELDSIDEYYETELIADAIDATEDIKELIRLSEAWAARDYEATYRWRTELVGPPTDVPGGPPPQTPYTPTPTPQGGGSDNIPRAAGGPVYANQSYLVGERGPEMFIPGRGGMIVPNSKIGGDTNITIDARGAAPGVGAEIRRALQEAGYRADSQSRRM